MKITRRDPFTGKTNTLEIPVTYEELDRWENGMVAQKAFPSLNADQREFIMTGIMPESWSKYISREDSDDTAEDVDYGDSHDWENCDGDD